MEFNQYIKKLFKWHLCQYLQGSGHMDHPDITSGALVSHEDHALVQDDPLFQAHLFLRSITTSDRLPMDSTWEIQVSSWFFHWVWELIVLWLVAILWHPRWVVARGEMCCCMTYTWFSHFRQNRASFHVHTCSHAADITLVPNVQALVIGQHGRHSSQSIFNLWLHMHLIAATRYNAV